jgi:hypothetical protein
VGDDPIAVESNRTLVADAFGVGRERLLFMNQRHGSNIVVVDRPWQGEPPGADALVTTSTDLALAVLVADCTPVLLVDRIAGVAAAVHAGRPGMMSGIVSRVVDAMTDLGASSISAVVGPSVCGRCYEVPAPSWPPAWSNSCGPDPLRCNGSRAAVASPKSCFHIVAGIARVVAQGSSACSMPTMSLVVTLMKITTAKDRYDFRPGPRDAS